MVPKGNKSQDASADEIIKMQARSPSPLNWDNQVKPFSEARTLDWGEMVDRFSRKSPARILRKPISKQYIMLCNMKCFVCITLFHFIWMMFMSLMRPTICYSQAISYISTTEHWLYWLYWWPTWVYFASLPLMFGCYSWPFVSLIDLRFV